MLASLSLVCRGALERNPELQVVFLEAGAGWLPYWLERVDYVSQQHRFWTHQEFGDALPSEVARDHFTFCFISDRAGVEEDAGASPADRMLAAFGG